MFWIVYVGLTSRDGKDPMAAEYEAEIPIDMTLGQSLFWLLVGIIILFVSSKTLVWGAVGIAQYLGVSDLVIGLTIVALGTSLPELAAGIASTLKNEPDIAIGNVVGSNLFNLLAVLAIPGIIRPGPIPAEVMSRDFPVMAALTVALLIMAYGIRSPGRINRLEALVLVGCYVGYQSLLYFTALD